jgi:hypothetical protein
MENFFLYIILCATQFLVFPISIRVDITVYEHENVLYLLNNTLLIATDHFREMLTSYNFGYNALLLQTGP